MYFISDMKPIPNCLHDWTPREFESLQRELEQLHIMQPPQKKKIARTGLKGCHYHKYQHAYIINLIIDGKKIYCGRMKTFNRAEAIEMQRKAKEKYQATH